MGVGGSRSRFSVSMGMGVSFTSEEMEKEVVRNLMVLRAEGRDDLIALTNGRAQDSNSERERDVESLCTARQAAEVWDGGLVVAGEEHSKIFPQKISHLRPTGKLPPARNRAHPP